MTDDFSFLPLEAELVGRTAPLPPHARVSATTSDGTVSAIRWGTGDPELVLLHGGGLNAHTWDATVLALDVPALAVDLPGHGWSDWRDDADYRPTTIAPAVAEALAQFAPGPRVIVGQSLGALTAAVLAGEHPDLVSSAVLIDAVPFVTDDLPADVPNSVRDFLAGPRDYASRDEIVDRALSFGLGGDREATARGVALNTREREDGRIVFRHHLAQLPAERGLFRTDFSAVWAPLESARQPLLLVSAENGFVPEALVDEFLRRTVNGSAIRVAGGHNVQEERPVELARLLATWTEARS